MKNFVLIAAIILMSFVLFSQPNENEKLIQKGVKRFYKFSLSTNDRIYYLGNCRYNQYSQVFSATIEGIDSSDRVILYQPGYKEMKIVADTLNVQSIFISLDLKAIESIEVGQ